MKNNFAAIESANVCMKSIAKELRNANKEYTSLSRVLKDIQRNDLMKAGYSAVFEAVGMPTDGKILPVHVLNAVAPECWGQTYDKKGQPVGEKWMGIWGTRQVTDAAGNKVVDEAGAPVVEAVLRKVTAWSPTKLFKMLAQSRAFKAAE